MGLVRLSLAKIWGERGPSIIVRYHEDITNIKEGVLDLEGCPLFSIEGAARESFPHQTSNMQKKPFLGSTDVRPVNFEERFLFAFHMQFHMHFHLPMPFAAPLIMSCRRIQNFINLTLELGGQGLFISDDPGMIVGSFHLGTVTLLPDRVNILRNRAWHSVALRKQ